MNNYRYAEILVDIEHHAVDQTFDYVVPSALTPIIEIGQRVDIPFGPRTLTGVVINLKEDSLYPTNKIKSIKNIRDFIPYFNEERLTLASFLSNKHIRPRAQYLNAMLPSALSMQYKTLFTIKDKASVHPSLRPYFEGASSVNKDHVDKPLLPLMRKAIDQNIVELTHSFKQTTNIKTVNYILLKEATTVRGTKQQAIIDHLKTYGAVEQTALLKSLNTTTSPLNALLEKGIIEKVSHEKIRDIQAYIDEPDKSVLLNPTQEKIKQAIVKTLDTPQAHLIHGVTGSGKTEIYIELIKTVRSQGKQALLLLPEIALTPKIVARFKKAIKEDIAIYHSALSSGEQYDQWRKVLYGKTHICIGARSSVFMPFNNLGIIIMDEEQSDAYIQRENPPYSAKEVASLRSFKHNAPLIYGSATPSVETYFQAKEGNVTLHQIKTRALNATLPVVKLINMKEEFKTGNPSMFSKALQSKIQQTLDQKEQIMILINRRGHNNFVICRECGKRIKCPECDISLTYHKASNRLKCHYCNYTEPSPKTCPTCHSSYIRYMGIGSERVEQALNQTFPNAKIYRMDQDTTTKKASHEKLIAAFENNGDILVGTQMITKGLDFENVTLVGVLSADMALFVPDFYAESETFSQLLQISGRSGRRSKQGHVYIQAYDSDHPVLNDVQTHDYENFYTREIAFRKRASVTPFYTVTQLLFMHKNYDIAYKKALEVKRFILSLAPLKILGPSEPKRFKHKNVYRVQLIIRHDDDGKIYTILHKIHTYFKDGVTIQINHHPKVM